MDSILDEERGAMQLPERDLTIFFKILILVFLLGGILGLIFNGINGLFCPTFQDNYGYGRWYFLDNYWLVTVLFGMEWGALSSIPFAIFYAISFTIITRFRGNLSFAIYQLKFMFKILLFFGWGIGGILGLIFQYFYPEWIHNIFSGGNLVGIEVIMFNWVANSTLGLMFMFLLTSFYIVFRTRRDWKTKLREFANEDEI